MLVVTTTTIAGEVVTEPLLITVEIGVDEVVGTTVVTGVLVGAGADLRYPENFPQDDNSA